MSERAGQRIGAVLLALVFLFSSFALTGFVIWQIRQNNKTKDTTAAIQDALKNQAKDPTKDPTKKETNKLEGTKLTGFTPVAKVDSLQKTDTVVGTGDEVKAGDTVTAHYTGALAATGVIFQSSHDGANQPIPFGLNEVIKGWTDGVPGMKVGGKRRLLIPADQAYGAAEKGGIPANSDLVFDIEITAIGAPKQ
jgi:FKBP-type peptidyl-prolyl cis-trans isomerase FkpA